jgi:hypothetical protein
LNTSSELEAFRKQAEGTNREYDRLLKEHAKLQVNNHSVIKINVEKLLAR